MKTYEEVLAGMHCKASETDKLPMIADHALRFVSLAQQVSDNPDTRELLLRLMEISGLDRECECERCARAFDFALSAYLNGVRVGMEMEKSE